MWHLIHPQEISPVVAVADLLDRVDVVVQWVVSHRIVGIALLLGTDADDVQLRRRRCQIDRCKLNSRNHAIIFVNERFSDENAVVTVRKRDLLPGKINGWLQVLGIQGRGRPAGIRQAQWKEDRKA